MIKKYLLYSWISITNKDWLIWLMQLLFYLSCLFKLIFYRPCISDDLKIGYHRRDHATQTDIKEIPELNELAVATQALIKEDIWVFFML